MPICRSEALSRTATILLRRSKDSLLSYVDNPWYEYTFGGREIVTLTSVVANNIRIISRDVLHSNGATEATQKELYGIPYSDAVLLVFNGDLSMHLRCSHLQCFVAPVCTFPAAAAARSQFRTRIRRANAHIRRAHTMVKPCAYDVHGARPLAIGG